MKMIPLLLVNALLLGGCRKEKNVEEFNSFVGNWELEKRISYVKDSLFTIEDFARFASYHSLEGSNVTLPAENTTYQALFFDSIRPEKIIFDFKNDGFLTFSHPEFGTEKFRIITHKPFKFDATIESNTSQNYQFQGYWLKLKNIKGKKFTFFFGKDEVRNKLITVAWFKGRKYYSSDNPDTFLIGYLRNGEVWQLPEYKQSDCYVLGLYKIK